MTMNFCALPIPTIPTVYFYVCLWPKRNGGPGPMREKKKQIFQIWNNVTDRGWKLFKTKLSSLLFRAHRDSFLGKNRDRSLLTGRGRAAIGGEPGEKTEHMLYVALLWQSIPRFNPGSNFLCLPKQILDDLIVQLVGNGKLKTAPPSPNILSAFSIFYFNG